MNRSLGTDWNLTTRMLLSMLGLAAVYLVFFLVLLQSGAEITEMAAFFAAILAIQFYLSDRLVLYALGARTVTPEEAPELHAMVQRLAAQADLPPPRVAISRTSIPNAFATGRSPQHAAVVVTTGLLDRLDTQELEAVLAHEITHIKNRDVAVITIASFFSTLASLLTEQLLWLNLFGGFEQRDRERGLHPIVLVYLASLLVWAVSFFLIRALSRYREYAADRGAAILTGAPMQLASALIKIHDAMGGVPQEDLRRVEAYNAFFIMPAFRRGSWLELLSTHPSLENRLAHLQRLQAELDRR